MLLLILRNRFKDLLKIKNKKYKKTIIKNNNEK